MPRPVILTLRVLAIGSALTVLACHVTNRQNQAAAGDRGVPGPAAPAAQPTWASSSKSIDALVRARDAAPVTNIAPPAETRMMGTKSGLMISPLDVQQGVPLLPSPGNVPSPRFAPGSKSAVMVSPADVKQLQQQAVPQQQSTPSRQ